MSARFVCAVLPICLLLLLGPATALAEDEPGSTAPRRARKSAPLHLSLGAGVFRPWDGNTGFDVSGSLHLGLGSDRFWVGGELEYRRFEVDLKQGYRPDMNSFLLRFSFQYHPLPRAPLSPYLGIGVGVALHKVDDNHLRSDPGDRVRSDVSGGLSLIGVAGVEAPLFTPRLHLFAEGRLGNGSDVWKRKGGNWQTDQVDGITGMGGLRFRF